MRVTIIIEDTPVGIATKARVEFNGVLDHASQSLALGEAHILETQMRNRQNIKCLTVHDGPAYTQGLLGT